VIPIKRASHFLVRVLLILHSSFCAAQSASVLCQGKFPNLLTDVCYDCMFPITLGGSPINMGTSSEDYNSGASGSFICSCENDLTVGITSSFWEPIYMVDTTNVAGCMPLLGGLMINPPMNSSENGSWKGTNSSIGGTSKTAFAHINEYINPIMTALGIISDNPCLDKRGFDTPYVSWADPTWNDDALSMLLTPYAYPFAGLPSIAAEAPDAISATTGFGLETLFWTAGAWGAMYPVTGNVSNANTPEQVAHLLMARVLAKLHASGVQQTTAGPVAQASCGALGVPEFLMDKRQYKTSRLFPFPDNLCTPISRPLVLQEVGAANPQYKDYGYFIFRKKDCCSPLIGASNLIQ
jgi:conjugal transfer pilus assembly protein TraU